MYVSVLPLEVRTTSPAAKVVKVWDKYRAAHVVIDHPNMGGGITVGVFGRDPVSGFKYPLLSTAIVASGHTVMKIGPEYTAGANVAKDYIPYEISFDVVAASGTNAYSIGASII